MPWSINLDSLSMSRNAEESISFYDRAFAEVMEAMFDRNLERCQAVTYNAWADRGLAVRLGESVSWIWEPYY
jgi:phosphatidylserine/phosphatidylglycerophosphate/cardiolipin synthase-like enzyme